MRPPREKMDFTRKKGCNESASLRWDCGLTEIDCYFVRDYDKNFPALESNFLGMI
ncbi:unnamed protein product, partial [Mycena citricolor]